MLTRVIVVALLFTALVAARAWFRRRQRQRQRPLMPGIEPGKVAIIYFKSPNCRQCRAQEIILSRSIADLAESVKVIGINAEADSATARDWQVLTVPSIFILDRDGHTFAVNNGLVEQRRLTEQVRSAVTRQHSRNP